MGASIGSGISCEITHEVTHNDTPKPQRYPFWIWWNLLSLDAPTIVYVWALLFVRAVHIPFRVSELITLVLAVWIIYASDRMLDVLRKPLLVVVSDRHNFYARHGRGMLIALLPITVAIAWISFTRLGTQTREVGLVMCAAVIFYFLAIHGFPDSVGRWFPKELVAGAIFAAGAAIPAWMGATESRNVPVAAVLVFGGLCGLNCIAIECWEHNRGERSWKKTPYWLIRLVDTRIVQIAAILVCCSGLIWIFGSHTGGRAELLAASALSLSLIVAIERQSANLSPQALRVLADAALLTPALFLLRSVL